jgi:hypothetical protein
MIHFFPTCQKTLPDVVDQFLGILVKIRSASVQLVEKLSCRALRRGKMSVVSLIW